MKIWGVILTLLFVRMLFSGSLRAGDVIVAVGTPGDGRYAEIFSSQAERWEAVCRKANKSVSVLMPAGKTELEEVLEAESQGEGTLWIVLVGHGTFDEREAKFNLEGEDVSAKEMSSWLKSTERQLVIVNTTAASQPFVEALSGRRRVVVTATKAPAENSVTVFGQYFVEAVQAPAADLDQDGETSVLEAFIVASGEVKSFYENQGRIASEEALIDDNGDRAGTLAKGFRGVLPLTEPGGDLLPDGVRAHQIALVPGEGEQQRSAEWRESRNALEQQLFKLRMRKDTMGEDEYFSQLEALLYQIAEHYRE